MNEFLSANAPQRIIFISLLAVLSACGGGGGGNDNNNTPPPVVDVAPTVSAGADRVFNEGQDVTLSGSAADSDGLVMSLEWRQVAGAPTVTLADPTSASTSFVAPDVDVGTLFTFELRATDDDGMIGTGSVDIFINPDDNNRVLLGPLIGAAITAATVFNTGNVLETAATLDVEDLERGGTFSLRLDGIPDGQLMLVTAAGGRDIDADDDGVLDAVATPNAGIIRAIGKAGNWRTAGTQLTAISEIAVNRLLGPGVDLGLLSDTNIEIRLTGLAQTLLTGDLDGDGNLDESDLLNFTPATPGIVNNTVLTDAEVAAFASLLEQGNAAAAQQMIEDAFSFDTFAVMQTNLGDIRLRLFPDRAPTTVANFVTHARNGYYDGTIFHRVVSGFVIQGGDPLGTGFGGASVLGGEFDDEIDTSVNVNSTGTLAMANSGPNTNGSQFFINLVNNLDLNLRHTVFGQVVDGLDVVNLIGNVPVDPGDRPREDVILETIVIELVP